MSLFITQKDTLPSIVGPRICAVGGGVILVSEEYYGNVQRSTDGGDTWTAIDLWGGIGINVLVWNGSYFLAMGIASGPSGRWAKSATGAPGTWTTGTTGALPTQNMAAWTGSQWGTSTGSSAFWTSPDGQTWTTRTVGGQNTGVIWDGSRFCVLSQQTSSPYAPLFYTGADGITWSGPTMIDTSSVYNQSGIVYTGSVYIAGNANGDVHHCSTTGAVWTATPSGMGAGILLGTLDGKAIAMYVGIDGMPGYSMCSADGTTWAPVSVVTDGDGVYPQPNGPSRVASADGKLYVATGVSLLIIETASTVSSFWTGFSGAHEVS